MAREFQHFAVTIPAGTPKATPQVTNLTMPPRVVREIEIVVPPGPRGNVGFQLGFSGLQLIPYTTGQFFIADDEVIHWPVDGMPDSGAWQMIAYNTGGFPHTIEVRFLVDLVDALPADAVAPISNADLASAPAPL